MSANEPTPTIQIHPSTCSCLDCHQRRMHIQRLEDMFLQTLTSALMIYYAKSNGLRLTIGGEVYPS